MSTLSVIRRLFGLLQLTHISIQRVSWLTRNKQKSNKYQPKTNRNQTCAALELSLLTMPPLDAFVLQQSVLPLNLSTLQQSMLPQDLSVLQESVLPLNLSTLQQSMLPLNLPVLQQSMMLLDLFFLPVCASLCYS